MSKKTHFSYFPSTFGWTWIIKRRLRTENQVEHDTGRLLDSTELNLIFWHATPPSQQSDGSIHITYTEFLLLSFSNSRWASFLVVTRSVSIKLAVVASIDPSVLFSAAQCSPSQRISLLNLLKLNAFPRDCSEVVEGGKIRRGN